MHSLNKFAIASVLFCGLVSSCSADGYNQGGDLQNRIHQVFSNCSKGLHDKCYGHPANCFKNDHEGCKILVAVDKIHKGKNDTKYKFQLIGTGYQHEGGYVAIGFSKDGTDMKSTSLVVCKTDENGGNSVMTMWSNGPGSPQKTSPSPKFIHDDYMQMEHNEGKLYCTFARDAKSKDNGYEFHLDSYPYDILIAKGGLKTGPPQDAGKINYHKADDRALLKGAWSKGNSLGAQSLFGIALLIISKIF